MRWRWTQQGGAGGAVLSFVVRGLDAAGARANAFAVIDHTQICSITANLGDTKSTITHPASTSHGRLTEDQRHAAGITQGLIRVAVGLDDVEDLKADLQRGAGDLCDDPSQAKPCPHSDRARRRPVFCTWAPRARRCTPGPMRATSAASSCCASRTPDVARSTQDSVDQILASMCWLGLDYNEGPVYQMQRFGPLPRGGRADAGCRHRLPLLLHARRTGGDARVCQRERGVKTHYDGRWRPAPGKTLPPPPQGRQAGGALCQPGRRHRQLG